MRLPALSVCLALLLPAGVAVAQTPPPENPGPAIQGNSDPAMPAKPMMKKPMKKKSTKAMHKKKM